MGNKYLSPEIGFAMGINYILQTGFSIPAELSAIAVMISYWDPVQSHMPAYIATFLILPVGLNLAGVK
jgi:amino acid transporter